MSGPFVKRPVVRARGAEVEVSLLDDDGTILSDHVPPAVARNLAEELLQAAAKAEATQRAQAALEGRAAS